MERKKAAFRREAAPCPMKEERGMGDFYAEKLVQRKKTGKDILVKCLMIALTVLAVFTVPFLPFGIILVLLMIGLDILVLRSLDVEFEYQYINGDIDIDKILHRERRKNVFSANIRDMELLAPAGTPQLDGFRSSSVYDFTSGSGSGPVYEMIIAADGTVSRVLFEPGEKMVEGIWMQAPGKVVRGQISAGS